MVSVSEATAIIESHLFKPSSEVVAVTKAYSRILAEAVSADRDFPPFNRVAMDGIAIQYAQFSSGQRDFFIESVAAAGEPQKKLVDKINCIEVMTGAPLPDNTDTVIRYEDITLKNGSAHIDISEFDSNQNIHARGQDARQDEILLSEGIQLSPSEIALIASVGRSEIKVYANPRIAIISTGNELVDINDTPLAHQIRRSNSYALQAAFFSLGCDSKLFHLPDDRTTIAKELSVILENHDLIVLSGGVSKGKFDYVPTVLEELGVTKHFHRVKQKPGKPFWFGTKAERTVFALPGNPVSTFMCFYKYIKPWLLKSLGTSISAEAALLKNDFKFNGGDLTYFLQVHLENENGKLWAQPIPGGGSGDFANLKAVSGFMELPAGQSLFKKETAFPIYRFR